MGAPFVHDLEISPEESIANCPATWLTGDLPDQAALVGVLNRLYDLGFSLLLVECPRVETPSSSPSTIVTPDPETDVADSIGEGTII